MADTAEQPLYNFGDTVVDHNNNEFEVVGVSHKVNEQGQDCQFSYHIKLKTDVAAETAEAEANAKAAAEAEAANQARIEEANKLAETNLGPTVDPPGEEAAKQPQAGSATNG